MSDINIAKNKPAIASNSMLPYNAQKAVDGVFTPLNRWMGFSSPLNLQPIWLRVDLGAEYWINHWVVRHMGSLGWPGPDFNMCDYRFQVSRDAVDWHNRDEVKNNRSMVTDRTFPLAYKARYVRVYVTNGLRCNPKFVSIVNLEVYEDPNAPRLTSLTVQNGATNVPLTPGFSSTTNSYTASVAGDVQSVTLTPTAAQSNMTIKVGSNTVVSGQTSPPISLNFSNTLIAVTVTSADGLMSGSYTITVAKGTKSSYLSNFAFAARGAVVNEKFEKERFNYTASVASNAATGTVTPTAEDPAANIKVNTVDVPSGTTSGPITLNQGHTKIAIVVTASDGSSSHPYTIDVTKP